LIKARRKTMRSESSKLICSIRIEEKLFHVWQQSITEHFYKKGDKTACSNWIILSTNFNAQLSLFINNMYVTLLSLTC